VKRKKGEGMIREYEPGKWLARLTINGKQKAFYGKSEKEATKKLNEFKLKISKGKRNLRNIQYSDFLDIWLKRKKMELKPQSYHRLVYTVDGHIKPTIGFYLLDKIDDALIQEEVINAKSKTHSYSSVKKIYDALNESLRFAKSNGDITHNPVDLVVMPTQASKTFANKKKEAGGNIEILSTDEIKRFITVAPAAYKSGKPIFPNGMMFILMLNTGIRIGEAVAVSWEDYDDADKTLRISASIIQNKDEAGRNFIERQESVKTRNSERILKLNSKALDALPTKKSSGYIFCTKDGNPIHPRSARDMLDRMLVRAEIPHKSTHVFRHTFASRLFEKDVDVKVVSELLGHASVATTYNTYITLIKKRKAKAMEAIEDMY